MSSGKQLLHPDDYPYVVHLPQWYLQKSDVDFFYRASVLFTDETYFTGKAAT
ncbi:hypothetical protein AVEN_112538-1, partial [Araneus ventricosus]